MALELQAIIHKEGSFDREKISISIQEELIIIYKKLYDIRMGFTFTHSTKHETRLMLPQIVYKDLHIHRNNIYPFLRKLIKLNSAPLSDNLDLEARLEKEILYDLQYLLTYYLTFHKNSSVIKRFLAFMLQPIIRIREHFEEIHLRNVIAKQLCITSKEEALDLIKKINERIEAYLQDLFTKRFSLRHPLVLLIHAAYIVQKRILDEKVRLVLII